MSINRHNHEKRRMIHCVCWRNPSSVVSGARKAPRHAPSRHFSGRNRSKSTVKEIVVRKKNTPQGTHKRPSTHINASFLAVQPSESQKHSARMCRLLLHITPTLAILPSFSRRRPTLPPPCVKRRLSCSLVLRATAAATLNTVLACVFLHSCSARSPHSQGGLSTRTAAVSTTEVTSPVTAVMTLPRGTVFALLF